MPKPKQYTGFAVIDLARQHRAGPLIEQWIEDGRGVAVYRLHGQVTFYSFTPGQPPRGGTGYYDPEEWLPAP